jgi:hypothetical protein
VGHLPKKASSFRDLILAQFEPDVALHLIEFGKHIATIEADFLIFMARKSLCLYDVLLRLGIPPTDKCVLSDRVLEMSLERFKGKRVALVDDTLILGTTLAKTKKLLLDAGADTVTVHVFCADEKWWSQDLLKPEYKTLVLSDERIMTFCAASVRALSLIPRPYITDFPISNIIKVRIDESPLFLSNRSWRGFNISTSLQTQNNVSSMSFFPDTLAKEELSRRWGNDLVDLTDIIKVRGFARRIRDVYWMQLVPIVVLGPLKGHDLGTLFEDVLARLPVLTETEKNQLSTAVVSPRAKQKVIQHMLSCMVGHAFAADSLAGLSNSPQLSYSQRESDRQYGPWFGRQTKVIAETLELFARTERLSVSRASVPETTSEIPGQSDIPVEILPKVTGTGMASSRKEIRNLIPSFSDLFVQMYAENELPTRERIKRLGKSILQSNESSRDRLDIGITWSSIVAVMNAPTASRKPKVNSDVLSLVLDFCNDQGIAVPITCLIEDVVFRAYRHGEDVNFTGSEPALAYEVINGYLQSAGLSDIPRLRLEKLLVLLMKIGLARRFLEPLFLSASGIQEVLRIGFYLHGAIPILQRGPRDRVDRDMWFSQYLQEKGVLKPTTNGRYRLGKRLDANFRITTAPDDAFELGSIVGKLSKSKGPLTDRDLTLLVTCGTPRHASAAIQVELDIIQRWYDAELQASLDSVDWADHDQMKRLTTKLLTSNAHTAVHAAQFKYVGYKLGQPAAIIANCSEYLERDKDTLTKRKWQSYWKAAAILEASGEREVFEPLLDKAMRAAWEIATFMSAIEMALKLGQAYVQGEDPLQVHATVQLKWDGYRQKLSTTGLEEPTAAKDVQEQLVRIASDPATYKSLYLSATDAMRRRMHWVSTVVAVMNPSIEEFGRLVGKRDYKYMLRYDLKDSTGNKTAGDVPEHRARVLALKRLLNSGLQNISRRALDRASEVFCWNGSFESGNDEKHVFIGGTDSDQLLREVFEFILTSVTAIRTQNVRIYIVPCAFAGSTAFRTEWDTEVSGERFWEYWSRLANGIKDMEQGFAYGDCFVALATSDLLTKFALPDDYAWIRREDKNITAMVSKLYQDTPVRIGSVGAKR